MGADTKELEAFRAKLEKLRDEEMAAFDESALRKLAAKLLELVINITPVGENTYENVNGRERVVRNGGTLRRGWTAETHEDAERDNGAPSASEISAYLDGVQITRKGNEFEIEIVNPVEYAAYVEYGHRQTPGRYVPAIGKRLVAGFVEGQRMLKKSLETLETNALSIVQADLEKFLKEALDG